MEIPELEFEPIREMLLVNRPFDGNLIPQSIMDLTNIHPITNKLFIKQMIHTHLDIASDSPIGTVTFSVNRNPFKYTISKIVTRYLLDYEVPLHTGMSIKELLDMPIYELQNLFEEVKLLLKKKKTRIDATTKGLTL